MSLEPKKIAGFPNYTIYPDGRVTNSLGKEIKHTLHKEEGYYFVNLIDGQYRRPYAVTRLLAEAFIPHEHAFISTLSRGPGMKGTMVVFSKDGNRLNLSLDNLEWESRTDHAIRIATRPENTSGVQQCNICKIEKTLNNFSKDHGGKHWSKKCHACRNRELSNRNATDEDFRKNGIERRRISFMKKKYGMTPEDKEKMLKEQNNKCKICTVEFEDIKHAYIDHDHVSGKVRAILCSGCNGMLGFGKDNPDILRLGAAYIESFKTIS